MLFTIEELLTIAKEKKASDVHVTVGLHQESELMESLLILIILR